MRFIFISFALCLHLLFAKEIIKDILTGKLDKEDNEQLIAAGSVMQILSIHAGMTSDIGNNALINIPNVSPNGTGLNIGLSVGYNYFRIRGKSIYMGARMHYFYSQSLINAHSLGASLYIHPIYEGNLENYPIIYFPSLVVGAGGVLKAMRDGAVGSVNGSYVEVGVALMKISPINVEILYRATFLNNPHLLGVNDVLHSMNVVFTIF